MKTTFAAASSAKRWLFLPCLLASFCGVGLSAAAAWMTSAWETRHAEMQFGVLAENHFMVLQNGINQYVDRLKAVRAFFDSSTGPITRDEFEAFTRPLLQDNSAIKTLSWVPRVSAAERARHERAGLSQGLPGYQLNALDDAGRLFPAPDHGEYFPIFYASLPRSSPVYGLDLGSEPATLAELERARDADRLGLSQVPGLVSSGGTESGFLFSLPVYRHGAPHDTVEERRRNLIGFVHGSLATGKMIDGIIAATKTRKGLDLYFFAAGSGADAGPTYLHPSRLRALPLAPLALHDAASGEYWRRDLTADGQPWLTMVTRPMPDGPVMAQHDRAWAALIFGLIITAAAAAYLCSLRRHTARMMAANRRISDLAQIDALTSLANRRAFKARLDTAFAACRRGAAPFAVLYFDIDRFKDVNDSLGHGVGDALLRQVAERVGDIVRGNDLVARIGGDEFAVLQSDVQEPAAASTLAAKIGAVLTAPYLIDGSEVHSSASIGIARYGPDLAGPDALMIQADLALYRAKEDGRNCIRFHNAELDREVRERIALADELRGAIERHELELYYQPQVELRSGRIIGLEALLRWNHPKLGQIGPASFIPIAERSGQILRLGQWVFDATCRQLRQWLDQGLAPDLVGVNFSALQFKGATEIDRDIADCLARWGVAPELIEIELTESVLLDITHQHSERFERLRRLGVRIAIDDFGTGYSSLSYLANYPVSRIKIAQELVCGVDADSRSATVVRAAIRLAHELGVDIIAEGVETEGQELFLLSAGCEHGQGYYFSTPVEAARATRLLRAGVIAPARPLRLIESEIKISA